jgi:lipoprotein signal peptidase
MKEKNKDIWFPAKKYGIGWGFPVTWQGWVVSLSYLLIVLGGSFILTDTPRSKMLFLSFIFILTFLFVYICIKRGEKFKWRWSDKKNKS